MSAGPTPPVTRAKAAVAVLEARIPEPSVLLIRRPVRAEDPWSGQWAFPGGRWQESDIDLLATARRELGEEVGLSLAADLAWTALPIAVAGLHRGLGVPVAPFHLSVDQRPALTLDAREVAAIRWCPVSELRDRGRHQCGRVPGGGERDWPHCDLDGTPLWGFTWRVLGNWLDFSCSGHRPCHGARCSQ